MVKIPDNPIQSQMIHSIVDKKCEKYLDPDRLHTQLDNLIFCIDDLIKTIKERGV